jgi:hypothetical protein
MSERFIANDGLEYFIDVETDETEIVVSRSGETLGRISLRFVEGDPPHLPDSYHITHLELDSCRGRGIGRRCLQLHREYYDAPITAGGNDGTTSEDGSHLTGDGPGFIAKMQAEGLVDGSGSSASYWDRFDE